MINSLFGLNGFGFFKILIIDYNFVLTEIPRILILFCVLQWYVFYNFEVTGDLICNSTCVWGSLVGWLKFLYWMCKLYIVKLNGRFKIPNWPSEPNQTEIISLVRFFYFSNLVIRLFNSNFRIKPTICTS